MLPGAFVPDRYPLEYSNGTLYQSTTTESGSGVTTVTATATSAIIVTVAAEPDLEFAALLSAVFLAGCLIVILMSARGNRRSERTP